MNPLKIRIGKMSPDLSKPEEIVFIDGIDLYEYQERNAFVFGAVTYDTDAIVIENIPVGMLEHIIQLFSKGWLTIQCKGKQPITWECSKTIKVVFE